MIKRRFYKADHGDQDDPSGSSSSSESSDSELEAEEDAGESEDEDVPVEPPHSSTSSGYESEDSSVNEVAVDSSGSLADEDDIEAGNHGKSPAPAKILPDKIKDPDSKSADHENDGIPPEALPYILKCKAVFKCRICPRIVCLNEESLKAHLKSKRHIRSEKLLKDGRLKSMLNSDGEVEDQETAAEMNARIVSMAQDNPKNKTKRDQQPRKRFRKKHIEVDSGLEDAKHGTRSSSKKQRISKKTEDRNL